MGYMGYEGLEDRVFNRLEEKEKTFPRVEKMKELREMLQQIAERYRARKIPIDKDGRISMLPFAKVRGADVVASDREKVRRLEIEWMRMEGMEYNSDPETRRWEKLKKHRGEQLEILKTVLFNKYLGEGFVAVRSSSFDDYKNGVDNVLLDGRGNPVCAFDEVSAVTKEQISEKRQRVFLHVIQQGGVELAYGISMKGEKVRPARLKHLPCFYLSLTPEQVCNGINGLGDEANEREVFGLLTGSLGLQVEELRSLIEKERGARGERKESLGALRQNLDSFEMSFFGDSGQAA